MGFDVYKTQGGGRNMRINGEFIFNSTKYDIWKFWMPNKCQQQALPIVAKIIYDIDEKNKISREENKQ